MQGKWKVAFNVSTYGMYHHGTPNKIIRAKSPRAGRAKKKNS